MSKWSKAKNKGKKEKETPKDCAAKHVTTMCFESPYLQWTGARRRRVGDKDTGSGRVGYGIQAVLTPPVPLPLGIRLEMIISHM